MMWLETWHWWEPKVGEDNFVLFIKMFLPTVHQISSWISSILEFYFHNIKVNCGNENSEERKKYSKTTILPYGI